MKEVHILQVVSLSVNSLTNELEGHPKLRVIATYPSQESLDRAVKAVEGVTPEELVKSKRGAHRRKLIQIVSIDRTIAPIGFQIGIDGYNVGDVFESVREAAIALGVKYGTVTQCLWQSKQTASAAKIKGVELLYKPEEHRTI